MAIHQPHDHLFKRVFGVPAEAASFLKTWLPAPLRRSLRWSTLKRHPSSFVDSTLRGAASDLLFEVAQTQVSPAQAAGSVRARLLQLTMMHAFDHAAPDARKRMRPLLDALEREGSIGQDDMRMFVRYILETGPDDTPEALGEILSRTAAGGEMRTSGERLRQEGRDQMRDEMRAIAEQRHREGRTEGQRAGRLEGQREGRLEGQIEGRLEGQIEGRLEGQIEGRLETIDGFLRTGVDWSVIERATGIDEAEYRKLTKDRRDGGSAARDGHGRD